MRTATGCVVERWAEKVNGHLRSGGVGGRSLHEEEKLELIRG